MSPHIYALLWRLQSERVQQIEKKDDFHNELVLEWIRKRSKLVGNYITWLLNDSIHILHGIRSNGFREESSLKCRQVQTSAGVFFWYTLVLPLLRSCSSPTSQADPHAFMLSSDQCVLFLHPHTTVNIFFFIHNIYSCMYDSDRERFWVAIFLCQSHTYRHQDPTYMGPILNGKKW